MSNPEDEKPQERDCIRLTRLAMARPNPVAAIAVVAHDLSEYIFACPYSEVNNDNPLLLAEMADFLHKKGKGAFAETEVRAAFAAEISILGNSQTEREFEKTRRAYDSLEDDRKKIDFLAENFVVFKSLRPDEQITDVVKLLQKMWDEVPDNDYKKQKLNDFLRQNILSEHLDEVVREHSRTPTADLIIKHAQVKAAASTGHEIKQSVTPRMQTFIAQFKDWAEGIGAATGSGRLR